jgi:hypothetical protein
MRTEVFNALQLKYGKLSPSNHQFFIKETKRLEKYGGWIKINLHLK